MDKNGKDKNIGYWRQYGDHVLTAIPYADEILVEAKGSRGTSLATKTWLSLGHGTFPIIKATRLQMQQFGILPGLPPTRATNG